MRRIGLVSAVAVVALAVAGCGGNAADSGADGLSGTVRVDGSSTVSPLSEVIAEAFQAEHSGVQVTVGTSGSGGGFEKFCAGETDISNASRQIADSERETCTANGIEYDQFVVANDGIAVVVHPENRWASCLTVDDLKRIWDRDSTITSWMQVDPDFPDEPIELFAPGTASGTFDYFTEAITGESGRSRTDFHATEDDNVIVQGVAGSTGGLGYFGLSYAEQNTDRLQTVAIDSGSGCTLPTTETVQSGDYDVLSRPLMIYPSTAALARPEGRAFVEYYIENADRLAGQALFVPVTDEQKAELASRLVELAQ